LTKCAPDDDNLRARMSGGEIPINHGILKDKSTLNKSKLAGTSNTVGTGNPICGVELELPHPPDSTLGDRLTNRINTGMITKGTRPPPPPESPPTIFNTHQKLNKNGTVYKDPPIFNHSFKFKGKDLKWKFQSIVPYDYKWSQCNVVIGWKNGETTNNLLKVIGTDDPVTCVIYTHENDLLENPGWKHPRIYEQALGPDKRNRNTFWGDDSTLELTQINEHDTFIGKGHYTKDKTPDGFKKTQVQIAQYQPMIGALQWIATIGRFSINTAVMTMSGYHMSPRVGNLNRLKHICDYLVQLRSALVRARIDEFIFYDLLDNIHSWTCSVQVR
jgi:hypothetical protein